MAFFGLSLGLDYYHSKNQFVGVYAFTLSDHPVPVPAPVCNIEGSQEYARSNDLALTNNHKIKRFKLGYGLSYAQNFWHLSHYGSKSAEFSDIKINYNVFGFIFPLYFECNDYFNIGIIYRPTFYCPDSPQKFSYKHLISIDFAWKIALKKS